MDIVSVGYSCSLLFDKTSGAVCCEMTRELRNEKEMSHFPITIPHHAAHDCILFCKWRILIVCQP